MKLDEIEVTIEKFVAGGRGFVRHDGKAIFVAGALPGERVRARIVRDRGRFAEAETVAVLASPYADAACPHHAACGGCDWMRLPAGAGLAHKAGVVRADFERTLGSLAGIWREPVPSPAQTGYRARVTFKLRSSGFGYFGAASHTFVPVSDCLVAAAPIRAALPRLAADAPGWSAAGFDEVELRAGPHDTLPVAVLRGGGPLPALPDYLRGIASERDHAGDCELRYEAAGVGLSAGPRGFVQVNLAVNDRLVADAVAALGQARRVADAFCGNGNFSLPAAARGKRVYGLEGNRASIDDAVRNTAAAGLQAHFEVAAEKDMPRRIKGAGPLDALLLDPPRAGAKVLLEGLAKLGALPQKIVYVSCDPTTLLRDAQFLLKAGRPLRSLTCYDMFPQTHHVECLAVFGG